MSTTPPRYSSADSLPAFDADPLHGDSVDEARETVRGILDAIRDTGWEAVESFSEKYDSYSPGKRALNDQKMNQAWKALSEPERDAFLTAVGRIERYQNAIQPSSMVISDGETGLLGEIARPLETVGCYIPGGRFPLPSTVLMTAKIAEIAGVDTIVVCTPPQDSSREPHPAILAALSRIDSPEVHVMGGAQAVGAMAYGCGPVPAVDLIAGPGNLYVTLAKKEVYGKVGIDLLAGPSEIAVVATGDQTKPRWVAADILSQAEHDPRARSYLLTPDQGLIHQVEQDIAELLREHPNSEPVRKALEHSALIHTEDLDRSIEIVNNLAPEHLELHLENARYYAGKCRNAGAIFCGAHTPEPVGDYVAGPSHTLPTSGGARFFSPLSVRTFMKFQSLIDSGKPVDRKLFDQATRFAEKESLWAHAKSLETRSEEGIS